MNRKLTFLLLALVLTGLLSTVLTTSHADRPANNAPPAAMPAERRALDEAAAKYQAEPTDANARLLNAARKTFEEAAAADPSLTQGNKKTVSLSAAVQMQALRQMKTNLTRTQKKIGSRLLIASMRQRGSLPVVLDSMRTSVKTGKKGGSVVDIKVTNRTAGLKALDRYNFEILSAIGHNIRAEIPLEKLEEIAALPVVTAIREPIPSMTSGISLTAAKQSSAEKELALHRGLDPVAARTSARIRAALAGMSTSNRSLNPLMPMAANVSEGDKTHRASDARNFFGFNGTGVKIGVLSDGVDSLASSQGTGDLGPVTVLGGQGGSGDEGTAMLEIVHDLAPGAQLFFATADNSEGQFAQNILDLRTAGCDIIVDDVAYLDESPFEDGPVAQAVNTVTAAGALYFSSAGNEGNVNDTTSGTWEGDFLASAAADPAPLAGANLHDFGDGGNSILVEFGGGNPPLLIWAEHYDLAVGNASTDFDLYDMDGGLTTIFDASTDTQDGTGGDDFPIEFIGGGTFGGERLLIDKFATGTTSSTPIMNLIVFRGELDDNLVTSGATRGHSAAADAFSVAATPAAASFDGVTPDGPFPNPFTSANKSESFTSDGPRRIILTTTGVEITPGNRTSTGGVVRQKPDITAADGVSTSAPGFNPFYGTSAAAPHAAAIAALIKGAVPSLTPAQIRSALISTAIDIEAPGVDGDTGAGIVMAYQAMVAAGATPVAFLQRGTTTFSDSGGGDGDGVAEPCERLSFTIGVDNIGGAGATGVFGTLTSSTPGVVISGANSAYPDIANGGSANNTTPFKVVLPCSLACATVVDFTLTVTYGGGPSSPQAFNFSVRTGSAGSPVTVSYTGPAVPIPDSPDNSGTNPGAAAEASLLVSGFTGNIFDLNFRIDGTACSATAGSTTVGLDHTFVSDLKLNLISPAPGLTTVNVINRTDTGGNNFCQTLLDDETANPSIQTVTPASAPFTGTFKPNSPLSAFDGLNPNGTWKLQAQDFFAADTGNIRAYSLIITPGVCSTTACSLTCPADITVGGSGPGTIVNYPEAGVTGGCGIVNYSIPSGSVFPVGQTTVNVTGESGGACSFKVTVGTQWSIDDVSHNEGNSGTTAYAFTISRNGPSAFPVAINYATANGSAQAPSDYTATPPPVAPTTVTFAPNETSKQVTILVNGDTTFEPTETFHVILSVPSDGVILDGDGLGTIVNDDVQPTISINSPPAQIEGTSGQSNLNFTATLSNASSQGIGVHYATVNGTATGGAGCGAGTDYVSSSGNLLFNAGETSKTISVPICGDLAVEGNEIFTVPLDTPVNATIAAGQGTGTGTITNDDALGGTVSFSQADYVVAESGGFATITVVRNGDTSLPVSVDYATPDDSVIPCATINGLASPRCDFDLAVGRLRFAAGETSKTFNVLISQDNFVEGPETLPITLSNLTGGGVLGTPSTATLTITDDVTEPATNPIDDAGNFVRQQYHDFLNREADAPGLAFWTNQITSCGSDQACISLKRINVSAAFFLAVEFQETGVFVRNFYVAALNRPSNMPRYLEFMRDTQNMQRGVIVDSANPAWMAVLAANKQAFTDDFVTRAEFVGLYPTTDTPTQYVDKLFLHAAITPTASERTSAIAEFGAAATAADTGARGRALKRVTDNATFRQREQNRGFVQMQYFGYLRRNPDDAPDGNFTGFDFWLNKLNSFNGDFVKADMVNAFITSAEYRKRFGGS